MLTFFEREEIPDDIGSDKAKLRFIQQHDVHVDFTKNNSVRFFNSGIFQLADGPPVLILPWFLKESMDLLDEDSSELEKYEFFDLIKHIKYIRENITTLKSDKKGFALEIIVHSFLIKAESFLNRIIANNYFVDIDEELSTIKGRWNAHKDLRKSHRPIKFSCSYSGLEKNIFELSVLKGFFKDVQQKVKADKNQRVLDSLFTILSDVEEVFPSKQNIQKCLAIKSRITLDKEWSSIITFIADYYSVIDSVSEDAGIAYKFPLDKFFEDVVAQCFRELRTHSVSTQERSLLMGGATWLSSSREDEIPERKDVKIYTIPDVVIESPEDYLLVECKYKPYKAPFDNHSNIVNSKPIDRNDRNQVLSFILSLQPDPSVFKKNISFSVVYPIVSPERFTKSILQFQKASLLLEEDKKLLQQTIDKNSGCLEINFIGINLSECLACIKKHTLGDYSKELYELISTKQNIKLSA